MQGDLQQAVQRSGNSLAAPGPPNYAPKSRMYLCLAFLQEGDLAGVLRLAREYLRAAEQYQFG